MALVSLLLTAGLLSLCVAEEFFVTPNSAQPCPQPCQTLDQYAQDTFPFGGHTNISLIFLEGVHNLTSNNLYILEVDEITFQPQATDLPPAGGNPAVVRANGYNILLDSTKISLYKMTFEGVSIQVGRLTSTSSHTTIISGCEIRYGELSVFTTNIGKVQIDLTNSFLRGGHTALSGVSINSQDDYGSYTMSIHNCSISQYTGHGIYISTGSVFITITDTEIYENTQGGLISGIHTVLLDNSAIFDSEYYGLLLYFVNMTIRNSRISANEIGISSINSSLNIRDTIIKENELGVVVLAVSNMVAGSEETITQAFIEMDHCFFIQNSLIGVALSYYEARAIFRGCVFTDNEGSPILAYQSSFELSGRTVFYNNTAERGAGLALYSSTVHFGPGSSTTFINNTAKEYGGAIYFSSLPPLLPAVLTAVESGNNSASISLYGVNVMNQECFFSVDDGTQQVIVFAGNDALLGGMDIFGPTIASYLPQCSLIETELTTFLFDESELRTLQISSDPTRVCFCVSGIPQCENKAYLIQNETRYPGESFTVSVVLVGFNYGRVAGTVYANTLDSQAGVISGNQFVQGVRYKYCDNLTYTISSDQTSNFAIIALTAQEKETQQNEAEISLREIYAPLCQPGVLLPCTALLNTPVYINVTLEACPLGFRLNEKSRVCDCDQNLAKIRDTGRTLLGCEIKNRTGYINREGTLWVGVDTNENNTDIYYWHRNCPNNFCNHLRTAINLKKPDEQCSSNRAGVLCGRCQPGYSLQLGGNKCIAECSNSYLALLIVFALLGVQLVALIKLLDLTVTSGTINGLIFYANVVWRNNAILFPQDKQSVGYFIITVPIAWMNLDFGIETCFGQNLNQLTKTGLQFVFPVYIWCIAGLIIIISHYSTRATRLFGNNSVAVLATLFLISYGKMFKNITDVFTFADVTDSSGDIHKVWSLDGNVPYGSAGHIALIIIALLFLFFFWLPSTLTLSLVPFLRSMSHLRPFRWIGTLLPFF